MPATSRTQSGPQAVNISRPILAQRTLPLSRRSNGRDVARGGGVEDENEVAGHRSPLMDANGRQLKEKNAAWLSRHRRAERDPRPGLVFIQRAVAVKSLGPLSLPQTVTVFSPAKINLFLAVTGRRADGYHDLVSVVAPLDIRRSS